MAEIRYLRMANLEIPVTPEALQEGEQPERLQAMVERLRRGEQLEAAEVELLATAAAAPAAKPNTNCWGC